MLARSDQGETHRDRSRETILRRPVAVARGGVSPGGIVTGVVVTFGALFLLSAVAGGVFAATDLSPTSLGSSTDVGIGVGVGLVVVWFLSTMWGGYTAGRMARGAGVLNGVLVPIIVLLIGILVAALVGALGASANLNLPFRPAQLPIGDPTFYDLSVGFGIAILVGMLLGGALGGGLGSRWHTTLERKAIAEEEERVDADRPEAVRHGGDVQTGAEDTGTRTVVMRREDAPSER